MTKEEIEELREQWEREREEEEAGLRRNRDDILSEKKAIQAKWRDTVRELDEARADAERLRSNARGESDERIQQLEARNRQLEDRFKRQQIEAVASAAITAAGADMVLKPHVVERLAFDGERVFIPDPKTGKPATETDMAGNEQQVTIGALVESFRCIYPAAFRSSGASGAGVPSAAETGDGKIHIRGDDMAGFTKYIHEIGRGEVIVDMIEG